MSDARARLHRRLIGLALCVGFVLTGAKFTAYAFTSSNAILTDALESIVNVVAGMFALYSVILSARPRDDNHPYGHGKIEYFAAGFEGGLIALASLGMLGKSIYDLFYYHEPIQHLALGLGLSAGAALGNGLMGLALLRTGTQTRSVVLKAEGKHLIADVVTSIGVVVGLVVQWLTGLWWIDPVLAMLLAVYILYMGVRLLRGAISGLMDESDPELVQQLADFFREHRRPQWIDVHHVRVQRFGSTVHIDCHLTLPWYYDLVEVRREVKLLEHLLNEHLPNHMEASIRPDPCVPTSCPHCRVEGCQYRQAAFVDQIEWTPELLVRNQKHRLETAVL